MALFLLPPSFSTLECTLTDTTSQDPGYKLILDPLLSALAEEASYFQRQWLEIEGATAENHEPTMPEVTRVGYMDILELLLAEIQSRLDLGANPAQWPFRSRMVLVSTTPVYLLRGPDERRVLYLFAAGTKLAIDENREIHSVSLSEMTLLLADQEDGATHGRMLFFTLTGQFLECIWSIEDDANNSQGAPKERYRILSPDRAYRRLRQIGKREVVAENFPQVYHDLDPSATAAAAVLVSPQPSDPKVQADSRLSAPRQGNPSTDRADDTPLEKPPSSSKRPRSFAGQLSAQYGPEVARQVGRYIETNIDMARLVQRLGIPSAPDLLGQQTQICEFLDEYGQELFLDLIRHEYDQMEIDRQKQSKSLGFSANRLPDSNYNYPFN